MALEACVVLDLFIRRLANLGGAYLSVGMASSTKVRLNFAPNQNHRDVKPAVVEKLDFDILLKTASNKLRIKAKRLFTAEGVEIFASNLNTFEVRCDQ